MSSSTSPDVIAAKQSSNVAAGTTTASGYACEIAKCEFAPAHPGKRPSSIRSRNDWRTLRAAIKSHTRQPPKSIKASVLAKLTINVVDHVADLTDCRLQLRPRDASFLGPIHDLLSLAERNTLAVCSLFLRIVCHGVLRLDFGNNAYGPKGFLQVLLGLYMRNQKNDAPSVVRADKEPPESVYLVLEDYGDLGRVYRETPDVSTFAAVVDGLIAGVFKRPVKIVAFNVGNKWSADVSREVAREIYDRMPMSEIASEDTRRFVEETLDLPARAAVRY